MLRSDGPRPAARISVASSSIDPIPTSARSAPAAIDNATWTELSLMMASRIAGKSTIDGSVEVLHAAARVQRRELTNELMRLDPRARLAEPTGELADGQVGHLARRHELDDVGQGLAPAKPDAHSASEQPANVVRRDGSQRRLPADAATTTREMA